MRVAALSLFLIVALAACKDDPDEPKTRAEPAVAAAASLPQTAEQKARHWWVCGDVPVSTELKGEMLMLSGPFGERLLPAQAAASGTRYADDKGNEFWNQGEEATLKVDWKDVGECKADKAT